MGRVTAAPTPRPLARVAETLVARAYTTFKITGVARSCNPRFGFGFAPVRSHPVLAEIGAKHGKSAAQVAIGWQVARGIPTFPKSVTQSRIEANRDVDIAFSAEDLAKIDGLDANHRTSWAGPKVERNGVQEPRDINHALFPFKVGQEF